MKINTNNKAKYYRNITLHIFVIDVFILDCFYRSKCITNNNSIFLNKSIRINVCNFVLKEY